MVWEEDGRRLGMEDEADQAARRKWKPGKVCGDDDDDSVKKWWKCMPMPSKQAWLPIYILQTCYSYGSEHTTTPITWKQHIYYKQHML